jgi:tRNA modification GTPase
LHKIDLALDRAIEGLNMQLSSDLVSQDLREAMHYLGEITGQVSNEEVLGAIFSKFCIGK